MPWLTLGIAFQSIIHGDSHLYLFSFLFSSLVKCYNHSFGFLRMKPSFFGTSFSKRLSINFFLPIIIDPFATRATEALCLFGGNATKTLLCLKFSWIALIGGTRSLSPEISIAISYHIIFVLICINNYPGSNIYISHFLMKSWPNVTTLSAFHFIALIVSIEYFYSNRFKCFKVNSLSFLFIRIITNSTCKIFNFN